MRVIFLTIAVQRDLVDILNLCYERDAAYPDLSKYSIGSSTTIFSALQINSAVHRSQCKERPARYLCDTSMEAARTGNDSLRSVILV